MTKIINSQELQHISLKRLLKSLYDFRYNEAKNRVEVSQKGSSIWIEANELDLYDKVNNVTKTGLDTICHVVGGPNFSKRFNPIKGWSKENKYDRSLLPDSLGSPNPFEQLVSLIDCDEAPALAHHLEKHFIRAFKCLFEPLYAAKQCFVFMGPQGIGKTPFVRSFLPANMQEFITENPSLSPHCKDSRLALSSNFMIIIDEIDDYFKCRDNRDNYKSFATKTTVNERLPYGRKESCRERIASFFGTCNTSQFLNDPTGTDRFIVFNIKGFKNKRSGAKFPIENFPMEQLWAWAYMKYKEGKPAEMTIEELLLNEKNNEIYKYNSTEFEVLSEYLEPANQEGKSAEFMKTTDICNYLNACQTENVLRSKMIGSALIRSKFIRVYSNKRYGYWVKKING